MTNQSLRSSLRLFHSSSSAHQEADSSAAQQEMSSGEADIHDLLSKRFKPSHLQVQDVSGGCGSFYAIVVASKEFQGLNTVKQHRMVNECLKDIIGGIHGLQVSRVERREWRGGRGSMLTSALLLPCLPTSSRPLLQTSVDTLSAQAFFDGAITYILYHAIETKR